MVEIQRTFQIDVNAEIVCFYRNVEKLASDTADAAFRSTCAVDENINRPKGFNSPIAGITDLFVVADINIDSDDICGICSNLGDTSIERFLVLVNEDNIRALLCVTFSSEQSHSRSSAGDKYGFCHL